MSLIEATLSSLSGLQVMLDFTLAATLVAPALLAQTVSALRHAKVSR